LRLNISADEITCPKKLADILEGYAAEPQADNYTSAEVSDDYV
jgi:hypothetical protein